MGKFGETPEASQTSLQPVSPKASTKPLVRVQGGYLVLVFSMMIAAFSMY